MAAAFCSQCGRPVRPGARFCGSCGAALAGVLPWQTGDAARASDEGQYAGFWIRFVAWFIDGVVISMITQPVSLAIGSGFSFDFETNAAGELTDLTWDLDETRLIIGIILGFVVPLVYYVVALSKWGQTLGALAVSIKVQHPDGMLLSPALAAVRYFGTIVSALVLLLGYFWMIWDNRKQTWHDKFANSVVVKVKRRGEV